MIDLLRRSLGLLLAAVLLLVALPAAAGAELQTIDFESGAALDAPIDTIGDITFPRDPGFRPYRTDVGTRAHSGTTVGDIGRCFEETGAGIDCEFVLPHTTAVLDRTAQSVTVFAGRFDTPLPGDPLGTATLTAYHGGPNGTPVATSGPVPVAAGDFDTRLNVASANTDIDSFTVTSSNAALGIDDVEVDFAGSQPDLSVAATDQVLPLVQGQQTQVPVRLLRVNGSNGTVRLSVSGLPAGVSGSFSPALVTGSGTSSTLTLTADPGAPDTDFHPTQATITADPLGDQNVGPAPRTAPLSVRVASSFHLSIGDQSDTSTSASDPVAIAAPQCAPVDVPLAITRDIATTQDVSLSIRQDQDGVGTDLPQGVLAQILDSPVVAPGGNAVAQRTVRLTVQPWVQLPRGGLPLLVVGNAGSGPNAVSRVLRLWLFNASPSAKIASTSTGSDVVRTPRFRHDGSRVRITGNGFCPGTEVKVGTDDHPKLAQLIDAHTIEFTIPRYALSGRVTILPPQDGSGYPTDNALIVDGVRNVDGFQFDNPAFGSLSWSELVGAFGEDDAYVRVNPCWPVGDCTVDTVPNPLALAEWPIIGRLSSAHCFGMILAVQDFLSGKESYSRYASPSPTDINAIPGQDGPGRSLMSFLDAEQVKQYSDEVLSARWAHPTSLRRQLDVLRNELAHRRYATVSIHPRDSSSGHVVLAYDIAQTGVDTADIYAYNPNYPDQGEYADPIWHTIAVDRSVIHVDEVAGTWSFSGFAPAWTGGPNDGSLWVEPSGTVPANPSLPGLGALTSSISSVFSDDAAAEPVGASANARRMPSIDGAPGRGGSAWVTRDRSPLQVTFAGVRRGRYSQMYTAPGFVASVTGLATSKGVRDTLRGSGDGVTLASGASRPLTVALARKAAGATAPTVAATVRTSASAHGTDAAGLGADGAVSYAHAGAATQVSFTLTAVRRQGGPATFASGPIAVRGGDRVSVRPLGRDLSRARVTIRDAQGRTTSRLVRNRARAAGRLTVGAPRVAGRRVTVHVELAGVHGGAVLGATIRLMRGARTLARESLVLKAATGAHALAWQLPRSAAAGRYRLRIEVHAVTTARRATTTLASVGAHRNATITLRR